MRAAKKEDMKKKNNRNNHGNHSSRSFYLWSFIKFFDIFLHDLYARIQVVVRCHKSTNFIGNTFCLEWSRRLHLYIHLNVCIRLFSLHFAVSILLIKQNKPNERKRKSNKIEFYVSWNWLDLHDTEWYGK